ncbi:hypothetical protein [Actinoplanes sp. N902-109]|uniref:hypothetical protein n=1 Tax=Actinoplanes sp. (strain N902-109) TaxID=649831 RepID=UPI0003295A42|nr:hypothetical protein [Actinoplanes sp. N902-109]AGL19166.1 hypothetical protein L083_5656 [Actinoplanes sp. N902-109]
MKHSFYRRAITTLAVLAAIVTATPQFTGVLAESDVMTWNNGGATIHGPGPANA